MQAGHAMNCQKAEQQRSVFSQVAACMKLFVKRRFAFAGATDIALQADRPDVLSDVCKSMRNIARLSDRAALYI